MQSDPFPQWLRFLIFEGVDGVGKGICFPYRQNIRFLVTYILRGDSIIVRHFTCPSSF